MLNLSIKPALARAVGKVTRRTLFDPSTRTELAPAVEREAATAISLLGEFDRVKGFAAETSEAVELERVFAPSLRHGPTLAYRVSDVLVDHGSLYTWTAKQDFSVERRLVSVCRGEAVHEAMLCTNDVINRYFGHWLTDGTALERLAQQAGLHPLVMGQQEWRHEAGYRDLLSLQAGRLRSGFVRNLWVIDDRGINDGWLARFEHLRALVRGSAQALGAKPTHVILSRGDLGKRRQLDNFGQIVSTLAPHGYVVVEPEKLSAVEVAQALANAQVVVAVEGSAQAHALMAMPRGAAMVTIMPPRRFNSVHKVVADAIGVKWAYAVAEESGEHSFRQPSDRLLALLDLLD